MSSRSAEGVIGPQLVVRGRLDGKGELRIEGVLEGEIDLDGSLVVGPEGTVVGPVRARGVEVSGGFLRVERLPAAALLDVVAGFEDLIASRLAPDPPGAAWFLGAPGGRTTIAMRQRD